MTTIFFCIMPSAAPPSPFVVPLTQKSWCRQCAWSIVDMWPLCG